MKLENLLELISLLKADNTTPSAVDPSIPEFIALQQPVIVRTYSAGNWFGVITKRNGTKIKMINARRMYRWQCKKSISLSGCALYGIDYSRSKIVEPVEYVWIEDIEIICCTQVAIQSLLNAPHVPQE